MSKMVVANWKSHKTFKEAKAWWKTVTEGSSRFPVGSQVVVCPPFPFVAAFTDDKPAAVQLGVQDISPFPPGAYTGAVSTFNLQDLNIGYALVGHSERRRYFHETNQDIANKVEQAILGGITPILCVDLPYLAAQVNALKPELLAKCIVAYEPLESIGTGDNEPVDQVAMVKEKIHQAFGLVPVIYGGSVTSQNALEYMTVTDGVLVGGHSLDTAEFTKIVMHASGV
jgi:triosephosphate isomerase